LGYEPVRNAITHFFTFYAAGYFSLMFSLREPAKIKQLFINTWGIPFFGLLFLLFLSRASGMARWGQKKKTADKSKAALDSKAKTN
jgi:hypothetical protein